MKKKIIIFGSNGQLGSCVKKKLKNKKNKNIFLNSKNGDISNFKKIRNIFRAHSPDIVINCAAITNVDYCEKKKGFVV
jgi:dTDP-4-dehydrorhamnose reductase